MDIPVSSTTGFIGIVLLGFGLFLVLAGFEIFSVEKVQVQKGPRTWGLGFAIVVLGIFLLYPELSTDTPPSSGSQSDIAEQVTTEQEPTEVVQEQPASEEVSEEGTVSERQKIDLRVPNDGIWTQPEEGTYAAGAGKVDSFAWSTETYQGDLTFLVDFESDFGDYGEAMVVIYGDGQSWSNGCLIFSLTGYFSSIRNDTIYRDDVWLAYEEERLTNSGYTMKVVIKDGIAKLYADDMLMASILIPAEANDSGYIGLVKHWESNTATYSNLQIMQP